MESNNTIVLPEVNQSAAQSEAQLALKWFNNFICLTQTDVQHAQQTMSTIASKAKELEATRTGMVKPLNDYVKNLNASFKPVLEAYTQCLDIGKAKVIAFKEIEERANKLAQEKADQEAREQIAVAEALAKEAMQRALAAEEQAFESDDPAVQDLALQRAADARRDADTFGQEAMLASISTPMIVSEKTKGARTDWDGECFDIVKLAAFVVANASMSSLLLVNQPVLKALAKAQKEQMNIDGCKAVSRTIMPVYTK